MQKIIKLYAYLSNGIKKNLKLTTTFTNRIFSFKKRLNISSFKILKFFVFLAAFSFIVVSSLALAGGEDILRGTDASLIATLNGSGKKYIYLIEGFLSLAMYIKTKNLMVLFGIVIVAVFFNIILKVAGAA